MSLRAFTAADVGDQAGRTFLVTGANTGLGFETAKVLAARGGRVVMACRSRDKAESARDAILAETPGAGLRIVDLDLGDLASVRAAAEAVADEAIDVLVNNAGLMMPPLQRTADGFEAQFGVNHLGTFALTGLVLPQMLEREGSRVVITSSNAHKSGQIDFRDPQAERSYGRWSRYSMSKLANLLHQQELQRRLEAAGASTIAVACHPGAAATELSRHMPGPIGMLTPLARPFLNSAAEGAYPTLAAATSAQVKGGDYLGPDGIGEWSGKARHVQPSRRARDQRLAERLWDLSRRATGVTYPV